MTRLDHPAHAELTALADGSLTGRRRRRLEERVAAAPALRVEVERQRSAVVALRSVALAAPAGLRARVAAERDRARRPARRRRTALGGALAGAVASGALALTLASPGGPGAPTVVEASELANRPATQAAPAPGRPNWLTVDAFGLAFPDWAKGFGWRATGVRRDEIDGRDAVTVFYAKDGRRVGYTILSGDLLEVPTDAGSAIRAGTRLRYVRAFGRTVVTWPRRGYTCILSAAGVERDVLLELAAWKGPAPAGAR